MPIAWMHRLTGRDRSTAANLQLGWVLTFVAGAVNAGGFLAVGRYTSHMTGIVSAVADDLALGFSGLALAGAVAVASFVLGAMCTAWLSNAARRSGLHSEYAAPLMLEAVLLLLFGLMGASLHLATDVVLPATVLLLCFIMGLQNAVITKVSKAQIRTTHVTGLLTDLGIELGRLLYWNRAPLGAALQVRADHERLRIHASLLACFFGGAVLGALAFKHLGYAATLPLAAGLTLLAAPPLWTDLRQRQARP